MTVFMVTRATDAEMEAEPVGADDPHIRVTIGDLTIFLDNYDAARDLANRLYRAAAQSENESIAASVAAIEAGEDEDAPSVKV